MAFKGGGRKGEGRGRKLQSQLLCDCNFTNPGMLNRSVDILYQHDLVFKKIRIIRVS